MLATIKGRIQTKLMSYILLVLITALFVLWGGNIYIQMAAIAMTVGLVIEVILGLVLEWQSGWITFAVAAIEFLGIANLALFLNITMPMSTALFYYLTVWGIIQLFLIYLFPVWRLKWNENGQELW